MDGIEKITARIRADADAELAQLREQTEAQILEIQTQSKAQADQERTAILARGRRAAEERLERLKSAAQLERRKLELAAKQEVLSAAGLRAGPGEAVCPAGGGVHPAADRHGAPGGVHRTGTAGVLAQRPQPHWQAGRRGRQ